MFFVGWIMENSVYARANFLTPAAAAEGFVLMNVMFK